MAFYWYQSDPDLYRAEVRGHEQVLSVVYDSSAS